MTGSNHPSTPRSRGRRILNLAWFAVGAALILEVAWIVRADRARQHTLPALNTSGREGARGHLLYCYATDQSKLVFAAIEGPLRLTSHFAGGERASFDTGANKLWFHLSRTEKVQVNCDPPRLFFVQAGRVETVELPVGYPADKFQAFLASPAAFDGADGFKRWSDGSYPRSMGPKAVGQ